MTSNPPDRVSTGAPGRGWPDRASRAIAIGLRTAPRLVVVGALAWAAALVISPFTRPDLDPLTAHPEAYANGPWARLMQVGYVGVAVAGAASAFLARRHRLAATLLGAFSVGALLIGLLPPTGDKSLGDAVFPYAQLAPLAFFPAIGWISWRERRRGLLILAALTWILFLPLMLGDPPMGGIINRAGDLAIAAWLVAFARS